MVKLYKQTFFNKLIIEINADNHNELVQTWYSFFNHGASNGELHVIEEDKSAYFYTTEPNLKKALKEIQIFKWLQEVDPNFNIKEIPVEIEQNALVKANEIFETIEEKKVIYWE